MEDWIEKQHYIHSINTHKTHNTNNDNTASTNDNISNKEKYVYISDEKIYFTIMFDKYEALDYSKMNNCKVYVCREKNEYNTYMKTGSYYLNGILYNH